VRTVDGPAHPGGPTGRDASPEPPPGAGWARTAVAVVTDDALGGRWTSLRTADREWLWSRPGAGPARAAVRPDDAFVDAGGVEECFPTVRGTPDHGGAWSRPWTALPSGSGSGSGSGRAARVEVPPFVLSRTIEADDDGLWVAYAVSGPSDVPFVHAVHALVDVGPDAVLHADASYAELLDVPVAGASTTVPWPGSGAADLSRLGPDDGTATCAILPGASRVHLVDGADALTLTWAADVPGSGALMLWRNLRGWPAGVPYRSIGVEPMLGRTADRDAPTGAVRGAPVRWALRITAWRRSAGGAQGRRARSRSARSRPARSRPAPR